MDIAPSYGQSTSNLVNRGWDLQSNNAKWLGQNRRKRKMDNSIFKNVSQQMAATNKRYRSMFEMRKLSTTARFKSLKDINDSS